MSASVIHTDDRLEWTGDQNKEGHRDFWITYKVETTDYADGPDTVLDASGLPLVGSIYNEGNDLNIWAYCRAERRAKQLQQRGGEKSKYWTVRCLFSTKPMDRCQDTPIEDPLLEPAKISGNFQKETRIYDVDRNGNAIETAAHQLLPETDREFRDSHPTVVISVNTSSLGLSTFASMVNTVNSATLWGMTARKILLSDVHWERKIQGSCVYYYTITLHFEIASNGFDKTVKAKGTHVLDDEGDVALNTDTPGNPVETFINASGKAVNTADDAEEITIERYSESNFLTLGIPTTL